ncbi:FkbM family methyltransferase [Gammaproteobacteria bacterium]|jgi:FkbM family methyltransferase|nr:FkbM family methyltransferase [Gammaproteobacteria bacterium]
MNKFIKNAIKIFLDKKGYRVFKVGPYSIFDFESFLYRHLASHKSFSFIQIGANDGVMNDPIYKFNIDNRSVVSGYVLEPLPDIFEKLSENYNSCPNIKAFNLAIHATESEMVLHRVKPSHKDKVPEFANGIASFNKAHWEKTNLIPDKDYMEEVLVKCSTFQDFIKSNAITELDLLLIDTEGYDYEILMSIDFSLIKPKIIRFEHGVRNKLMSNNDFINLCNHLNSFGYQVIAESYDATAYLLNPSDLIF